MNDILRSIEHLSCTTDELESITGYDRETLRDLLAEMSAGGLITQIRGQWQALPGKTFKTLAAKHSQRWGA